jgi:hypothetical protein
MTTKQNGKPDELGCDALFGSSDYRYLGDFAACEMWAARSMSCDTCRVSWTGCWDNFLCPECGMGELPGFDSEPMTMDKMKEMHESMISPPNVKGETQT